MYVQNLAMHIIASYLCFSKQSRRLHTNWYRMPNTQIYNTIRNSTLGHQLYVLYSGIFFISVYSVKIITQTLQWHVVPAVPSL